MVWGGGAHIRGQLHSVRLLVSLGYVIAPLQRGTQKYAVILKNQLQNRYPSLRLSGPIIFHDLVTCGSNEDYKISSSHY